MALIEDIRDAVDAAGWASTPAEKESATFNAIDTLATHVLGLEHQTAVEPQHTNIEAKSSIALEGPTASQRGGLPKPEAKVYFLPGEEREALKMLKLLYNEPPGVRARCGAPVTRRRPLAGDVHLTRVPPAFVYGMESEIEMWRKVRSANRQAEVKWALCVAAGVVGGMLLLGLFVRLVGS